MSSAKHRRARPGRADRSEGRTTAHPVLPAPFPVAPRCKPTPATHPALRDTSREKTAKPQHAANKTHRKPLKTRLDPVSNRNNSTPFFRTESQQKAKVHAEREGLTSLDRHRREFPASQLIENKARKNAFYSRTPKVEVYENKGQSAILLAPQTRVFRFSDLGAAHPVTYHLSPPMDCASMKIRGREN